MKKIFFILMMVLISRSFISSAPDSSYCEGWDDGYCEGWKDVKGEFTVCPVAPVCPVAKPGKDNYKDGYNRGFKTGYRNAKKDL